MARPSFDEPDAEFCERSGALNSKQVWVLLLCSVCLVFVLSVQLVEYCRILDAARLAGDSSGHIFDSRVIRRLMAAPDPVHEVILEHLDHVIEKYRASRCAFIVMGQVLSVTMRVLFSSTRSRILRPLSRRIQCIVGSNWSDLYVV